MLFAELSERERKEIGRGGSGGRRGDGEEEGGEGEGEGFERTVGEEGGGEPVLVGKEWEWERIMARRRWVKRVSIRIGLSRVLVGRSAGLAVGPGNTAG